jgi:hypothetical protein
MDDGANGQKKIRYVFVFTYGRSGSTLLSGILNSLEGYCIRGENNNALHALFLYFKRIRDAPIGNIDKSAQSTNPWYGFQMVDLDGVRAQIRCGFTNQVLNPEDSTRVTGFKEIRCSKKEIGNFPAYVKFIEETFSPFFPCKIIFNHRNLENVAKSGWWRDMANADKKLNFMEDRFNGFANSSTHFHFHYDRINEGQNHIRELMDFLGEEHDFETVRLVLQKRHSY